MLREDNNGFVNFPGENKIFSKKNTGKTIVYLVAFDSSDISNKPYILSNLRLSNIGILVSDDINQRDNKVENLYFNNKSSQSFPMTSSICIGWSDFIYDYRDGNNWFATFKDLTHEGKKLYYSIKKLHNNKEVRILTFNNI